MTKLTAPWIRPILMLLLLAGTAAPAAALTDEEVERRINELKLYLYERQSKDTGGWYYGNYHSGPEQDNEPEKNKNLGGPTALATLALLVSGESSQDPRLVKAINYLRGLDMYGTYALSLKVHVWSYLPDRYLDNLANDAGLLLGGADPQRSSWRYIVYPNRSTDWDHSTDQYGILGMWQFAKRGGDIRDQFWERAAGHFFNTQNADGGWSYKQGSSKTSMTCAGLTCLYVVQQELFRDANKPPQRITESINKGMEHFQKTYTASQNVHGGAGYYRYGVERVALASGVKYVNDKDWFETTGGHIIESNTSSLVNAAFDLMFLSRGRVPVWVNKIKLREGNWNNRPNDMYFTSRHLSRLGEGEVNWQYVELDRPVFEYLPAPAAWLSSDTAVNLSDAEKAGLKKYLDLGGMLIANSEASSAFEESIRELAREMYPDYRWVDLDTTHPIANAYIPADVRGQLPVQALTNGVRDVILMPNRDWGLTLQKEQNLTGVVPGQLMTNIYAMVSGRGTLPNRLVREFPEPAADRGGHPEAWVAQARFGTDGELGNPEPAAWTPIANLLGDKGGLNLQWAETPLAEVGAGTLQIDEDDDDDEQEAKDIRLLHLAGGAFEEDHELTDAERDAIKTFVEAGGTVLVEGVGGRSEFAANMAKQLANVFGSSESSIIRVDPVISGDAGAAGRSVSKVAYRRFSVVTMDVDTRPRLKAINVDGRAAVIFSSEDLSLGALGVRHWGINGYQPDSARQILINILLAAGQ